MAKPKPKKKPELVTLVAIPTGKHALSTSGGAVLWVSTHVQKAGKKVFVIVCGFSTAHGADNAFPVEHVESVIDQWYSLYRRGWRFEVRDRDGMNPNPVVFKRRRR